MVRAETGHKQDVARKYGVDCRGLGDAFQASARIQNRGRERQDPAVGGKGKITLVNLWATWCGPCRNELPFLEKLTALVRGRKDLAVVTLNVDDNLGLVLRFLKESKYTFPVLPAADYVNGLIKELSIPRNWIVDEQGVLRQERVGFGNANDQWIDEMIAAMEKAGSRER